MVIFSSRFIANLLAGMGLFVAAIPGYATDWVAKTYPVKDFSEVFAVGNVQFDITQDGTEYMRVEASPEVMERIRVDLTGKRLTLEIRHKSGFMNWFGNDGDPVRVLLRVKQLNHLELAGAARAKFSDFQSDNFFFGGSGAAGAEFKVLNADSLKIQLSGASNTFIDRVNSQQQKFELSGASNLEIKDTSQTGKLLASLSGASNMRARALKARNADVGASGASHMEFSVIEHLRAEASGASNINYYGSPKAETDSSGASQINARGE